MFFQTACTHVHAPALHNRGNKILSTCLQSFVILISSHRWLGIIIITKEVLHCNKSCKKTHKRLRNSKHNTGLRLTKGTGFDPRLSRSSVQTFNLRDYLSPCKMITIWTPFSFLIKWKVGVGVM
jgi:hypothetical protein